MRMRWQDDEGPAQSRFEPSTAQSRTTWANEAGFQKHMPNGEERRKIGPLWLNGAERALMMSAMYSPFVPINFLFPLRLLAREYTWPPGWSNCIEHGAAFCYMISIDGYHRPGDKTGYQHTKYIICTRFYHLADDMIYEKIKLGVWHSLYSFKDV